MDDEGRANSLHRAVVLLILLLGALAIVAGSSDTLPSWRKPIGDLGIALCAAALYAFIEMAMHIDLPSIVSARIRRTTSDVLEELEFMKDIFQEGVTRVLPSVSSSSVFEDAHRTRQIWMMFNTGRTTAYNQGALIQQIAQHNGQVRILMADGFQSFWQEDDVLHGNGVISEFREIELTLTKLRDIIQQSPRGDAIEIRKYQCVPQCSMFIVDDTYAWIIPYLPYQSGSNIPTWRVDKNRGSLFDKYKAVYEDVWNRAVPIEDLDREIEMLKQIQEESNVIIRARQYGAMTRYVAGTRGNGRQTGRKGQAV